MKKTLCVLVFGYVLCLSLLGSQMAEEEGGVCFLNETFQGLDNDHLSGWNPEWVEEDLDWVNPSGAEHFVFEPSLKPSYGWWLLLVLGSGYVINGGNIASRFFPLVQTHAGVHVLTAIRTVLGVTYIGSMYAKLIEKVELEDPNVVNGIKGKAHIDLGKTAGFYMDFMIIAMEYVRSLRLEGRSEVVSGSTNKALAGSQDEWGEALDGLLVGAGWIAHVTGTSMNVASLSSKFYKVQELEACEDATEAEMERAWKDVYVYIAKLGGGVVGLGAKLAYLGWGRDPYHLRESAMFLSVLGSSLFLYWDMGGLLQ